MLLNFFKVIISVIRFFNNEGPSQEYQNLEYPKKFFPNDFEELKKLNIDQI